LHIFFWHKRLPLITVPTSISSSFLLLEIAYEHHLLLTQQQQLTTTNFNIIEQGTIVEWTVQVGQKVQEEDVIALIETDKVTVEIKANTTGVVTQQYGAV
jgi:acetyl/propionyl-CoA carboxylase alpha subunit